MAAPIFISAERQVAAPADIVYSCIANYRDHHRPGGFLPSAFTELRVERGGIGAGTIISFTTRLGGVTRHSRQQVSEPQPGRVLVEAGSGATTTFTVEPAGQGACHVRIDTLLELGSGVRGLIERLLAPRLLLPLYRDELDRLDRRARDLAAGRLGGG